ncbi:MAG TPA: neuraminidase-like domain-containing protein [Chitinophagaceae bacterium]|nr:neuraminidase-like domain-containing protein [Chitinophagaceae bacterium]
MPNVYAITGASMQSGESSVANSIMRSESEILSESATIAYPTLEELFGNMDYCSCEHCKSVLSPAAYLVELLQFIDLSEIPHAESNPIDVLLGDGGEFPGRRPDIQHIQLTCENTNMALPYIDLVNEILEYYILNGNLINLKGHDITEEITQSELLAEPQFVNEAAYDLLKTKVYPYNLPFHQPLETLRQLFQMWGVSLADALNVFSTALSSRKEALRFSEDEYKTITSVAFKPLPEYFGQPPGNTIAQLNAAIANGKTFSRTVGISYEDLFELLKTNFINPGYMLVPLLQQLQISLVDLQKFYTGILSDGQLDALIPPGIDPADYGGDVKTWLRNNRQLIMGLITLTDLSAEPVECNLAEVELRYALPDNSSNSLTSTDYYKFHRFLRVLRKTGWSMVTLDNLMKAMLPLTSDQITDGNIDATFVTLFDRLANFKKIADYLSYSEKKFSKLLLILDATLSLPFRQEECAKLLKLSIPDLEQLSAITGIDPLANDLEANEPSLLKLIMIVQQLKEQSLKVVDLAYILHHADLNGKLTPTEESLRKSIKILRDTLNVIEKENNVAPDNADFNFAKSKMLLVYDAGTTDTFFGLLLGTKTFAAPFVTVEESLPVPLLQADPKLGFDPFKKELTYAGVLSATAKTALENAADALVLADMGIIIAAGDLVTFIADFKTALNLIATNSNTELLAFGVNFPELKTIYDSVKLELTPAAQSQKLVNLILPELKSKLKNNALRQALIGILKSDPDTVSVLTDRKEIIRSAGDISKPVLFDFTQLEEKIVFDQNQVYHFYIDIPATDEYLFYISAPQNTIVTLKIEEQIIINNVTVGASLEVKNAAPVSLKAGVIQLLELTIAALPATKLANIWWRTKGIAKAIIPDSAMYVNDKVSFAKTSLIRLSKASQLQNLFKFTAGELDYFASTNSETKDFLNDLDTDGTISGVNLIALWEKIWLLSYFNRIKKENEPEDNTWVQVLKDPSVRNVQGQLLLESFNMWKEADLTEVLTHFAINRADLSKLSGLKKIIGIMNIISEIGYSAVLVESWVTNDPSYALVASIKDTVKMNVTEAAWLETMQTVSDPVRNLLRDALVSYILQYMRPSPEIVNSDKLYEYFLIDVEMDACMKTSRIRLALSTVQLFIQRCLLNLEPLIDPASIRTEQWAWMKRYRVWEANRKVFLYPENWLEPELRDNKSSLFKELEGELLQGEITDESAELAFLNYLKKLDDIAKLEMVGMYLEENEQNNQDDDILHVFGRTNGNTRQYYYRRYEYGYWTPWEKVSLNIEGEHIFPIIWRKRLFVFWLNIFEKPSQVANTKSAEGMRNETLSTNARKNIEINMCWGEYYKGKWTSPKSTDLKRPMIVNNLGGFDSNALLVYGRKEKVENPAGKFRERVVFYIRYRGSGAGADTKANGVFTFTSKNAAPYLEYIDDTILYNKVRDNLAVTFFNPYSGTPQPVAFSNTNFLMPDKNFRVNVKQPFGASKTEVTENVLTKKVMLTNGFSILPTWHPVENQVEAPISYADEHSTFFIKPDEDVFYPIWRYDDYYPLIEISLLKDIPVLVEKPVKGWPPEEIINKGDIVSNPWEWNRNAVDINLNYTKMLATTQTFNFAGVEFGTDGKNISSFEKTVKTF